MDIRLKLNDDFFGGTIAGVLFCVVILGLISYLQPSNLPAPTPFVARGNEQHSAQNKPPNAAKDDRPPEGGVTALDNPDTAISDGPEERDRRKEEREAMALWWTKANIVIGLLLTAGILAVTYFQLRTSRQQGRYLEREMVATETSATVSKESADAAKAAANATIATVEQMRLEQRAWIGFRPPVISDVVVGNEPFRVSLDVKNFGPTPGFLDRRLTHAFVIEPKRDLIAKEVALVEKFISQAAGEIIIMPHVEVGLNVHSEHPIRLTEEVITKLEKGELTLIVVGRIEYRDVFEKRHTTQACYRYSFSNKRLWAYDDHNHMT